VAKQTLDSLDMAGRRVLMRVDFNVPLDDDLNVTDDRRIRMALPTIKCARDAGAKVILMSHLGRPGGKVDPRLSLKPAAARLGQLLETEVKMAPDCTGDEVRKMVDAMADGDVLVLENLRFHPGETEGDPDFAKSLASLADLYVNDAFGTAHRKHASTYGVPAGMPKGTRAIGFLMQKELKFLGDGAKVSDKIGVIENLLGKVDRLLIGGAMAYVFMAAQGRGVGRSKVERQVEKKGKTTDMLAVAKDLLAKIEAGDAEVLFPVDHLVAREPTAAAETDVQSPDIEEGWMGLDIGPETVEVYREKLADAKTVVWNGPMGMFEVTPFAEGTRAVCEALAQVDEVGTSKSSDWPTR